RPGGPVVHRWLEDGRHHRAQTRAQGADRCGLRSPNAVRDLQQGGRPRSPEVGRAPGQSAYETVFLNARALAAISTAEITISAATCGQKSKNVAPRMMIAREML